MFSAMLALVVQMLEKMSVSWTMVSTLSLELLEESLVCNLNKPEATFVICYVMFLQPSQT